MKKIIACLVILSVVWTGVMPPQGFAQSVSAVGLMPMPGTMVALTPGFIPANLRGMIINPNDPFKFDFIISRGDEVLTEDQKQMEYAKLIKYFLASLAVPDTDQWVNLSPYEQDRIIPDNFGMTEMGRDLLAQDYLLKQISASLTNPDTGLGKKFWDSVYEQAYQKFGTTDIPTDTFNKVWITPDKAVVYEKGNTVYVLEHRLKVMMDKDYLATKLNGSESVTAEENEAMVISQRVMKEVIIPAIEKEVNEGRNFAPVRQIYSGMLLASWYKLALRESILGRLYADKGKIKGIDQDPGSNQQIYEKYTEAFRQGVFNMIKEDVDIFTQEVIPRKYFSGGALKNYLNSDSSQNTAVLERRSNNLGDEAKISVEAEDADEVSVVVRNSPGAVAPVGAVRVLERRRDDPMMIDVTEPNVSLAEPVAGTTYYKTVEVEGQQPTKVFLYWDGGESAILSVESLGSSFLHTVAVRSADDMRQLRILLRQFKAKGYLQKFSDIESEINSLQALIREEFQATGMDSAQKVVEDAKYGGIDFAQSNLDLQIQRDGAGVVLPVSQQNLDSIKIDGLVPVILNIQPATSAGILMR